MSTLPRPDTRLRSAAAAQGGQWTTQTPVPNATSPRGPGSATFQDNPYLAWRAEDSSDSIWLSSSPDGQSWSGPWNTPNVGTSEHPALTAAGIGDETLYLAWKGAGRDQNIWWSTSADGQKWEDQQMLGGAETACAPAMVSFHGVPHIFWRGSDTLLTSNQSVYMSARTNTGWTAPVVLPGIASSDTPAVAVLDGILYLANRGTEAPLDNDKWIRLWSSTNAITRTARANPADAYSDLAPALAAHAGTLHLAWKSATGDEIWYSSFDGDHTWQSPTRAAGAHLARLHHLTKIRELSPRDLVRIASVRAP
ncbi:hypothetical protein [Nocardia seriolae]|uniref:Exo-alpha-sialidase n=1 Tax=Nocardia seriolae TaxID=37332 RepID=A0A0B8N8Y5_9NOCA|nr:hypothetical protein [Nocardia seriolae]APB00145.1 hypothetical protein NS506_06108 [Nocardia seriolae]MTJ64820.1 hypothetical protein [Nocardia seriolae]MTJ72401.1 hypothetical protein [Nocardia seriolae]MTJ89655.1 hypothetical protein [Nocardia seriolae]MTK33630.1 hypothetical protein [Nocardia seriolae]